MLMATASSGQIITNVSRKHKFYQSVVVMDVERPAERVKADGKCKMQNEFCRLRNKSTISSSAQVHSPACPPPTMPGPCQRASECVCENLSSPSAERWEQTLAHSSVRTRKCNRKHSTALREREREGYIYMLRVCRRRTQLVAINSELGAAAPQFPPCCVKISFRASQECEMSAFKGVKGFAIESSRRNAFLSGGRLISVSHFLCFYKFITRL